MDLPLELAENLIERGVILHSDIFPDIDHGKFFVVIGVDEDFVAGFFFINSNINRAIWNKQEQLAMQYPMRKADYDSYVMILFCVLPTLSLVVGKNFLKAYRKTVQV